MKGQREVDVYLARVSAVTQHSVLPLTRGQTISGLAVNIKGDGFFFCPWSQVDTDPCNTDSTLILSFCWEVSSSPSALPSLKCQSSHVIIHHIQF